MSRSEMIDRPNVDNLSHLVVTPPKRVVQTKPAIEVKAQLATAETLVGVPFFQNERLTVEALNLDTKELKKRYPRRYAEYLKLLAEIHHLKRENYRLAVQDFEAAFLDLNGQERMYFLDPTETQVTKLKERFDHDHEVISTRNYLRFITNLEEYITRYEPGHALGGPLREHQQDVFHAFFRFLNSDNGRKGYIDMPTGTGKTAVFVELVEALAGHPEIGEKAATKTLVLVPTVDLIHQTLGEPMDEEDEPRGFRKFAPNLRVTTYFGDNKDLTGGVVLMTYNSLINLINERKITENMFDLIVMDEAHNSLGDTTRQTVDALMSICSDGLLIGFTATTEYSPDEERQVWSVFGPEIHRLGLREAIQRGILSPVDWDYFQTDPDMLKDFHGRLLSGSDYSPALLKRLNNEARNQKAVEYVERALRSGLQTLVSCLPVNGQIGERHIETMAELINAANIQMPKLNPATGQPLPSEFVTAVARVIDGRMSGEERLQILADYRAGRIHVLTFVDILKEGVDLPDAKALINLRPTRSPVLAKQRLGRILRNNGQRAWVVEFRDPLSNITPYDMDWIMADDPSGTRAGSGMSNGGDKPDQLTQEELLSVTMGAHEIQGGSLDHTSELPVLTGDFVRRLKHQPKVYVDSQGKEWLPIGEVLERFDLSRAYLTELLTQGGLRGELKTDIDRPTQRHLLYDDEDIRLLLEMAPEIKDRQVELGGQRWLNTKGIADWLRATRDDLRQVQTEAILPMLLETYFGEVVQALPARKLYSGTTNRYELVYRAADLTHYVDDLAEWLIFLTHERRKN
ncbi:MAG: DEAD/DEAH box helicase [Patescibacteria group bacterium]